MKKESKIYVAGHNGMVGSILCDELVKRGHKVIVLDNFSTGRKSNLLHHKKKNVRIFKIDISKNEKIDKYFSNGMVSGINHDMKKIDGGAVFVGYGSADWE